jgi:hypothetical protein
MTLPTQERTDGQTPAGPVQPGMPLSPEAAPGNPAGGTLPGAPPAGPEPCVWGEAW